MKKSQDSTIISALRILARDIESEDGVANAALQEAADRLCGILEQNKQLHEIIDSLRHQNSAQAALLEKRVMRHSLLDSIAYKNEIFAKALVLLSQNQDDLAMRLPHWDPDIAIERFNKERRPGLRWIATPDELVQLKESEIMSNKWQVWYKVK